MDAQRREIAAITQSKAAPTFENTIAALEDSGRALTASRRPIRRLDVDAGRRAGAGASSARWRRSSPRSATRSCRTRRCSSASRPCTTRRDEGEAHARAAAARVELATTELRARRGSSTPPRRSAPRARSTSASPRSTREFSQNVLADEEQATRSSSSNEADLAGLPDVARAAALAAAAEARGQKGKWAITNTRSSMEPFLTLLAASATCARRSGRSSSTAATTATRTTTTTIISEILKLRAERAKLLGYPTHAHWRLEDIDGQDARRARWR